MATFKRVDGDYVITTINNNDRILLVSDSVLASGDITALGNISANNLSLTGSGIVNGDLTVVGNLNATGNIAGDKIASGTTSIEIPTPSGNITINVGGQPNVAVFTTDGANITSNITASGNVTGGNLTTVNAVVAGSGSITGNLTAGNLSGTNIAGTLSTAAQPNITSVGNLTLLDVTGNITASHITATANLYGTVTTPNQPRITQIGQQGYLDVTGNITTGNLFSFGNVIGSYIYGDGSFLTNISAGNITGVGAIANGTSKLEVQDANGVFLLSVNGTANLLVFGETYANYTVPVNTTGNVSANYFLGNGALLTGVSTSSSNINNGTSYMSVLSSGGNIQGNIAGSTVLVLSSAGANVTGTLNATGNANVGNLGTTNAVLAGALSGATTIDASGTVTGGNLSTSGQITSTRAGNLSDAGGQLYLNGAGNNRIDYSAIGTGAPTFTTRSAGTKINLYPQESGSAVDYAIGIDAATLWTSVPQNDASMKFKWYGGTTEVANLSGTGALNVTGNITGGNLSGTNIVGTLTTAAQTNITSLGTLTSLDIIGNITQTGNLNITGNVNATGNLNYQNVVDLVVGDPLIYLGANNVADLDDLGFVANWDDGTYQHGGFVRNHLNGVWGVFGNVVAEPTTVIDWGNAVYQPFRSGSATFAGANINGALTGATTGAFSGNVSAGNMSVGTGTITGGNIVNSNANGVGNIGSSTVYFNTVFAQATSAQYADLAEVYVADQTYDPGTVLKFGGSNEVTISDTDNDYRVAGVVSTNPAHLMNSGLQGVHTVKLALVGRVPCLVRAPVSPGDILVSAEQGWAKVNNNAQAGRIIGKSLGSADSDGLVEIVVGKH